MPPGKRRQSNAMLYVMITFVGLSIIATTVAVIYYVKAEELRTAATDAQKTMDDLASREEARNIGGIVGAKLPGESRIGTMAVYLDQMVSLVKGGPVQVTSAEVKVGNAMDAVRPLLQQAQAYVPLPATEPNAAEPNSVSLTKVAGDLMTKLQQTMDQRAALQKALDDTRTQFDDAAGLWQQTQQTLETDKERYRQQVAQIKVDYNDLKVVLEQSSEQRADTLLKQLEAERAKSRQVAQDLSKTQAELAVAQEKLGAAVAEVTQIQPTPDQEAAAYLPDGKIILVDEAAGIVHIDLGSDDHVYRGLTFSVYDKAAGVSKEGQSKAEIEVFSIAKKVATARVLSSEKKNPIATSDIIANLIWDRNKENRFVIVGDFDLNDDGTPDYDAADRIAALIQKWGGSTADSVTAKTDYVILGTEPQVPREPTFESLADDPDATARYDTARQRLDHYNQIQDRAKALWVPIFTYDRFLNFTGYNSQVGKPGAF